MGVPIVGKQVKIFKKRNDAKPYITLDNTDTKEKVDMDQEVRKAKKVGWN